MLNGAQKCRPSRHLQSNFQTCYMHFPDTLHTQSRQHSDTTKYPLGPNGAKPVQSWPFRHVSDTHQTPYRHPSDTLQTPINKGQKDTLHPPSRHLICTFQTPSIHNLDNIQTLPNIYKGQICPILSNLCLSDTLQTPFRHPPDTLHVLSRHLRCTFQTPFIISRQHSDTTQYLLDPNWAKHFKSGPSRHLPDTFQTRFRHLPDTLQTPFRHPPDTHQ